MTTCAISSKPHVSQFPMSAGYHCWEWVASLPVEQESASIQVPVDLNVLGSINGGSSGGGSISRKKTILGYNYGKQSSPTDIYQLAIAARKARKRISVTSVGDAPTSTVTAGEGGDRAVALRTAFASQRKASEISAYSFDSSNLAEQLGCWDDDDDEYLSAEELLFQLGFGGPAVGMERVPERFMQPSQVKGVDYSVIRRQLEEAMETMSSRALSCPPSRRSSSIARFQDSLRRKSAAPTRAASFDQPSPPEFAESVPPPTKEPLRLDIQMDHLSVVTEETALTPTNLMSSNAPPPLGIIISSASSHKSSLASSRRSSLRRQECVDQDVEEEDLSAGDVFMNGLDDFSSNDQVVPEQFGSGSLDVVDELEHDSTNEFEESSNNIGGPILTATSALMESVLPTVYVTPPPSTIFSQASVDQPESISHHDVDPIIAVLQLASEAYRVRLDYPGRTLPVDADPCDWNHNLTDIKDELRAELDKTDDLLQRLRQRLSHARAVNQSYDSSALRGVLADMTNLLQQQQRLYRQVNGDYRVGYNPPLVKQESTTTATTTATTSIASQSSFSLDDEDVESAGPELNSRPLWLKGFERRLTASIRKTIRKEMRRAKLSAAVTAVTRSRKLD